MSIIDVVKNLEGKTIKSANIWLSDGIGENLDLVFTDGTCLTIYGEMADINELKLSMHQ